MHVQHEKHVMHARPRSGPDRSGSAAGKRTRPRHFKSPIRLRNLRRCLRLHSSFGLHGRAARLDREKHRAASDAVTGLSPGPRRRQGLHRSGSSLPASLDLVEDPVAGGEVVRSGVAVAATPSPDP